jgi:GGDEF domain-containing protein
MANGETEYGRPPVALILTAQEWVSLSVDTLFSPRGYATLRGDWSGAEALRRVRGLAVDVGVIGRDVRDMTGARLCRLLREQRLVSASTPLVLLATGAWSREEKLDALRGGAWDTLSLPLDGEEFFLKVDAWVRAKLAGDAAQLRGLLDAETGLYNRQGLEQRMSELGAAALRHGRPLGCVIALLADAEDVRHARAAGEGGEGAGPRTEAGGAPAALAGLLRRVGRTSDTLARLGDGVFVIFAPETDPAGAIGLMERLRAAAAADDAGGPAVRNARFGCFAVPNFRNASLAPSELIIRAAEALRAGTNVLQCAGVPAGVRSVV